MNKILIYYSNIEYYEWNNNFQIDYLLLRYNLEEFLR